MQAAVKVVELLRAHRNGLSPLTFPLVPRCFLPPLLLWWKVFCYKRLEHSPEDNRKQNALMNKWKENNNNTSGFQIWAPYSVEVTVGCWQTDEHNTQTSSLQSEGYFKLKAITYHFVILANTIWNQSNYSDKLKWPVKCQFALTLQQKQICQDGRHFHQGLLGCGTLQ